MWNFITLAAAAVATTNPAPPPPELNKPMLFSFLALFVAFVAAWEYARKRVFHETAPRSLMAHQGRMAPPPRLRRVIDEQQYHNN